MNEHILQQLTRPFVPEHVTWKPGATTKDKSRCLAMAYADLRAYQNRLDEICGLGWSVSYEPWGDRLICHLTIAGVTRSSTGESNPNEGNAGTSAEAQSFKRACVMFGLGRYLYDLPSVWVGYDGQKRAIDDAGHTQLMQRYRAWHDKMVAKLGEQQPPAHRWKRANDPLHPSRPARHRGGAPRRHRRTPSRRLHQ